MEDSRIFQVATAAAIQVKDTSKNEVPARFLFNKALNDIAFSKTFSHIHYVAAENKGMYVAATLFFMINPNYLNVSPLSGCTKQRKGTQRKHNKQHPPPMRTTSTHNQHNLTFNSFLSTNISMFYFSIGAKQNQKCTLPPFRSSECILLR